MRTITFYGKALIDGRVCVFPSSKTGEPGPDGTMSHIPLVTHYDQIVARYPNTLKGNKQADADALARTLAAR